MSTPNPQLPLDDLPQRSAPALDLLAGVKVLDLTSSIAGPYAGQLLADMGANVVKVEKPGSGDDARAWGPPFLHGESLWFMSVNRGKHSICLDLKAPEARERLQPLLETADVLVEQFRPGVMERLGLGYEAVTKLNPRLIYCSITGFGQTGPYAPRAGYDALAQGLGGIMSITGLPEGEPGSEPVKVGVGIADIMTGMYAAVAILAALRHRDGGGDGQHIDMALLDTQVSWLANEGMNYLISGQVPKRRGTAPSSSSTRPRSGSLTGAAIEEVSSAGGAGMSGSTAGARASSSPRLLATRAARPAVTSPAAAMRSQRTFLSRTMWSPPD